MTDVTATSENGPSDASRAVYLTAPDEIVAFLKIPRNHSARLELRLPGSETVYTGRILDLAGDHFLLQDIRPRDGMARLRVGTRFSFAARVDGLYIYGEECSVSRVDSERGLPYYRITLPRRMLRQQRRRHTRINVPPRVSPNDGIIDLTRSTHDTAPLQGQIIDISVGGCRAVFRGAVVPPLGNNEELPRVELRVSTALSLAAAGAVRHSAWDARERTTTCGIEFVSMDIADRRRLEHYVQQLAGRNPVKV